jgi:hypothetical protein
MTYPGPDVVCKYLVQEGGISDPVLFLLQFFDRHSEAQNPNYKTETDLTDLTKKYYEQQIKGDKDKLAVIAAILAGPKKKHTEDDEHDPFIEEIERELANLDVAQVPLQVKPASDEPDLFSRRVNEPSSSKKKKNKKMQYRDGQLLDLGVVGRGRSGFPHADGDLIRLDNDEEEGGRYSLNPRRDVKVGAHLSWADGKAGGGDYRRLIETIRFELSRAKHEWKVQHGEHKDIGRDNAKPRQLGLIHKAETILGISTALF